MIYAIDKSNDISHNSQNTSKMKKNYIAVIKKEIFNLATVSLNVSKFN